MTPEMGTTPHPASSSSVNIVSWPSDSGVLTVGPSPEAVPISGPKVAPKKVPSPIFKLVYRDPALETALGEEITSPTYGTEALSTHDYWRACLGLPTSVTSAYAGTDPTDAEYRLEWARPQLRGVLLARIAVDILRVHSVSMLSRIASLREIGAVHPGAWVAVAGDWRADDDGTALSGPRKKEVRLRLSSPDPLNGWPTAMKRRPIFAIGRIDDLANPCLSVAILTF